MKWNCTHFRCFWIHTLLWFPKWTHYHKLVKGSKNSPIFKLSKQRPTATVARANPKTCSSKCDTEKREMESLCANTGDNRLKHGRTDHGSNLNAEAQDQYGSFLCFFGVFMFEGRCFGPLQDLKPDLNLKRAPYFTSPLSLHVVDMNG